MKNFENEYREMIQEEMPDLWGRIEAGLTEKQSQIMTEKMHSTSNDSIKQNEEIHKESKKVISGRFLKYSGLAAACLCGVIILPVIVFTHSGRNTTEEASYSADTAQYMEATECEEPAEYAEAEESADTVEYAEPAGSAGTIENAQVEESEKTIEYEEVANAAATGGTMEPALPDLPMLTISEVNNEGMGYEGLMAYDVSELVNENPWSEELGLATLPVYKNPLELDEMQRPTGGDFDKMKEYLYDIADILGVEVENYVRNTYDVSMETEGIKINVDQTMLAEIWFDPAVEIPEEYHFGYDASLKDVNRVAEYFQTEYKDLMGFESPTINITGGDYNIYANQSYGVSFYDASGSIIDQMINYNFNRATFHGNEEGQLYIIRLNRTDLSQKLGDYPIITAEEAKERLLEGNYITTVPYEIDREEFVAKVELVYRINYFEEYFIPYYRFYVEVPEETQGELKTYGAYYVPAVQPEYLSGMPVWDGEFN